MKKRTKAEAMRALLQVLRETGPRKRTVCVGIAGEEAFEQLLREGKIKTKGSKRGTEYAHA